MHKRYLPPKNCDKDFLGKLLFLEKFYLLNYYFPSVLSSPQNVRYVQFYEYYFSIFSFGIRNVSTLNLQVSFDGRLNTAL